MWQDIEARIAENESEGALPLRQALWQVFRASELVPGDGATKKMVSFRFGRGDRLLWEVQAPARNVFLHHRWRPVLEGLGLPLQLRRFVLGMKDGGRHSALSRSWALAEEDCLAVPLERAEDLRRLLDAITSRRNLMLKPEAITRWISRLRVHFPDFDRFDRPSVEFDARERDYKVEFTDRLTRAFAECAAPDNYVDAFLATAAKPIAGHPYNLIDWRPLDQVRKHPAKSDLGSAIARFLERTANGVSDEILTDFMAEMAQAWNVEVNGSWDAARQLAEAIALHLFPQEAIFFRRTLLDSLYLEATGTSFPRVLDAKAAYAAELEFARAVFAAFADRGLAPRDMIDVQSTLWVVQSYKTEERVTEDLSEAEEPTLRAATNLILYGPPGTGKTYRTAWEAVRLCHGDAVAHDLSGPEKRAALMAEYGELVAGGRVEFVTFHQSMSYEEFVEGLRPQTGPASTDAPEPDKVEAGFRLEPCDGVFKGVCARAEQDVGENAGADRLDRSRRIIRLGLTGSNWRDKLELALKEGRVEWPHGGSIDWSPPEYDSWEAIKAKRQETAHDVIGNHPTVYGTWLFRGAKVGEYVALTVGKSKIVALGKLSGEYRFEPSVDGHPPLHVRPVEWIWHDLDGVESAGIYEKEFTSFHTAYPMPRDQVNWDALDAVVYGAAVGPARQAARAYVLIIDEINRANISKVFGELITLLETDKRIGMPNEIRLTLPYSKKSFGVPANLHIIGTMNTADRSIALLDTALRRRFTFVELMPEPSALSANLDGIDLQRLLATINERIEYLFDRDHLIGHAYFTGCRSRDDVEAVMRHKIIPLLAEYFYEDWSKVAAVLGDSRQDRPRFLIRDEIEPPAGLEAEEFSAPRYRWRVLPPRDASGQGGFDFSEFSAG